FVTATPLQVAQMGAIIANGGFLYRPRIVHHMTDENGNLVVRNGDDRLIVVLRDEDGNITYQDRQGNAVPAEEVTVPIQFDDDGNYIFQPEVLNAVDVDRQWLDIIAQGMHMVNGEDGTGSGYVDWLDDFGVSSAGKTGTSEFCDNIAIKREWCRFEDIERRRILPTHAWYVGYAPYEDPEIAVSCFMFNGDEGSRSCAPIVREIMAAYFGVDSYAPEAQQPEEGAGVATPPAPTPEETPPADGGGE
ncbi:MAG TPA: penicillin-binding transpeptidase domain-containing protein, partial [Candidatus Binatia bacterium]|nr:penicillin-binding transpeptidase domain-containing protein [Candidatus Binatia bacterium]